MTVTDVERARLAVLEESPYALSKAGESEREELADRVKVDDLQHRRNAADAKQRYSNLRSRCEAMTEVAFQAQITATDAVEQLREARLQTVAVERELARLGEPIGESLAAYEAKWFMSRRWRDFTNRYRIVFGNGQPL
jgi:hypothetical protein